jgi:hypothetical protein
MSVCISLLSCLSLVFVGSAWAKPAKLDDVPRTPSVQSAAADMPGPIPENLKISTVSGTYSGRLALLETDAKGTITQLAIYGGSPHGVLAFDGCGAKLVDLPQLLGSHHHVDTDSSRVTLDLTIKTKGRCIDRIAVRRVHRPRYDFMLNLIHDQLKSVISILKDIKKKM